MPHSEQENHGEASRDTPCFSLRLFGAIEVRINGNPMRSLRSRKGLLLLALLAVRGRPTSRQWIAENLWPDSDTQDALRNLRNSLHDLRSALDTDAWRVQSSDSATLDLNLTDADCDVLTFDRLIKQGNRAALYKAIELHGSPLLIECDEIWSTLERNSRLQQVESALRHLADHEVAGERYREAISLCRKLIDLQPYDESARLMLMRCLSMVGDYAGASAAYRDFRQKLHSELMPPPSSEALQLYQQIQIQARTQSPRQHHNLTGAEILQDPHTTNFPCPFTTFVGRAREISELSDLITRNRLVTLAGAGGIGKTRLALETAAGISSRVVTTANCPTPVEFDQIWFVDLAAAAIAADIAQATASAIGAKEQPRQSTEQSIYAHLASAAVLLILDNCDLIGPLCASFAERVLQNCGSVRILATSRVRLGARGEQVYSLAGLSTPRLPGAVAHIAQAGHQDNPKRAAPASISLQELLRYDAPRLFEQRASLNRSEFRLTDENANAVALICSGLDGLPLALELASARMRVMSVFDLADNLASCLALLTGGDATAPSRQQTLRSLIDYSYQPLDTTHKIAFGRLSVFSGSFDADAAASIVFSLESVETSSRSGSLIDALDHLCSLVDNSLLVTEERQGHIRYRMLETIRSYSSEKLTQPIEHHQLYVNHAQYYARQVSQASAQLDGEDPLSWLDRIDTDYDNVRSALDWLLRDAQSEYVDLALSICADLYRYWFLRGFFSEADRWISEALSKPGGSDLYVARAHLAYAGVQRCLGKPEKEMESLEQAIGMFQANGDHRGYASALGSLCDALIDIGDTENARRHASLAVDVWREIGDRSGEAKALGSLGYLCTYTGDYDQAQAHLELAIEFSRQSGAEVETASLMGALSNVFASKGDIEIATILLQEECEIWRRIGNRLGEAWTLCSMGVLAYRDERLQEAKRLILEAMEINRSLANPSGQAWNLEVLCRVQIDLGEMNAARSTADEAKRVSGANNYAAREAWSMLLLARLASLDGNHSAALVTLRAAAALMRQCDSAEGKLDAVRTAISIFFACGKLQQSAVLEGSLKSGLSTAGYSGSKRDARTVAQVLSWIREQLTDSVVDELIAAGCELTPDEAILKLIEACGAPEG